MKQNNFQRTLYSTAGVVAMFVVLLAFYVISSAFKTRGDLTVGVSQTRLSDVMHRVEERLRALDA